MTAEIGPLTEDTPEAKREREDAYCEKMSEKNWKVPCQVCGAKPTVADTGLCGANGLKQKMNARSGRLKNGPGRLKT